MRFGRWAPLGETLPRIRATCVNRADAADPAAAQSRHLALEEREEISRGIAARRSARGSRAYRPAVVDGVAGDCPQWWPRCLPALVAEAAAFDGRGARNRASSPPLGTGWVADKLDGDWSPQQIAQWFGGSFAVTRRCDLYESIYRDLICRRGKYLMPACSTACEASVRFVGRAARSARRSRPDPEHGLHP